jgi:hypothetical protein
MSLRSPPISPCRENALVAATGRAVRSSESLHGLAVRLRCAPSFLAFLGRVREFVSVRHDLHSDMQVLVLSLPDGLAMEQHDCAGLRADHSMRLPGWPGHTSSKMNQ